ncbi:MAG: SusC/RagA family TonB-linked outer membrane protein [Bacteroidales bacterium]|nr:SusC/RagA family TonB-linked outer membrane protein [Bacteroidales bacterium]
MKKALFTTIILLFSVLNLLSQVINISGKVISSTDKTPIPGASITVVGTTIGISTDFNGDYSLTVPQSTEKLMFNFIGMKSQDVLIAGRTIINIELDEELFELEEVVTIGYGVQKKSDLTGSISSISSDDIDKMPVMSIDQAMQGKATGVQITQNSGAPGSNVMIRIRGVGTVNNSNPLYVIDGLATSSMNFLNPSDIKSIEILKDASATAIYGSRGANGVILISTKSGGKGKTEITFDAYTGLQEKWRTLDLMNAFDYATITGKDVNDPQYSTYDTDWQSEIFRLAPVQNYYLSATGGNEESNYSISGGYFQQDGIIIGSDYERITFRINSTHQLNKRLKIGENISFTHDAKNSIPEYSEYASILNHAIAMAPFDPVYNEDGSFSASSTNDVANPIGMVEHTNNLYKSNRVVGNLFAQIELLEGLKFKTDYGIDLSYGDSHVFIPAYDISPDDQNLTNVVIRDSQNWTTWQWENTLTYHKTINKHDINLLVGMTAQDVKYNNVGGSKSNTPTDDPEFWYLDAATEDPVIGGGAWEWSMASYLGRFIYNYNSKYLLTASMRVDGSSKFGTNNKYGYFPSGSLGWKISEEDFFIPIKKYINNMKLRVGYGQIGNQEIGLHAYETLIKGDQNYVLGTNQEMANGSAPFSIGNPNLKWETTQQLSIGLDIFAFENKINLIADYYYKKTKDMLLRTPVPMIFGNVEYPFTNAGEIVNEGIEISFNYRNHFNKVNYDIGFNISKVNNIVNSLGNGGEEIYSGLFRGSYVSITEVGKPIASFYGLETDGIFQNDYEVEEHINSAGAIIQPLAQPGDIRFIDRNDDGEIDIEDNTIIGSPLPDFTYGFNFSADYKFIDLAFFFQGVYGNDIFNGNKYYTEGTGYYNLSSSMNDSWTGEGTSNELPNINGSSNNLRISSRYIEDGSYLRLKNIQLGFTLPKKLLNKFSISHARFYIGASNLFTFTKYEGFDPEIGEGLNPVTKEANYLDIGIDRGSYPQFKTYLLGLNIKF